MRMYGRAGGFALAMLGLSLAACGDDDKKHHASDEGEETDGSVSVHADGGGLDASRGVDASRSDAQTGANDDGGAQVSEDGAVVNPGDDDASTGDIDAAQATNDAASSTGSDAASDAASSTNDASSAGDASSSDAGPVASDAATASDAGDASIHCDINSPTYGCGQEHGESWVVFANGVEVDRDNQVGWSPFYDYVSASDAMNKCALLTLAGSNAWVVPDITDVRTMAAGCAQTVNIMPGSPVPQCQVQSADTGDGSNCTCNTTPGSGPNNGLFCRADAPDCVTLWTRTSCVNTCGALVDPWFYDVTTGSVVLGSSNPALATNAKFRCVTFINHNSLP